MTDAEPDTRPVITNMANYANINIPNYARITKIPSGYLPTEINTSTAQRWDNAFYNCRRLTSLPDPFYDTSNATNMYRMFYWCSNLITVPNFDTSNATNMRWMFHNCSNLTTVPNFDTSNVTSMGWMFGSCLNLTTVPNFNTSNVTDMSGMFSFCNNLTTIPNFNTSNVTDMCYMFNRCTNLTTIPNFDTGKVTIMSMMFHNCTNIKGDLYIESNNVINAYQLFTNTSNYTKNIYCHSNTNTYNTIYANMGNNTYNSNWNTYLLTMEDNYAVIPYTNNGIYRFPTNKIQILAYDLANINTSYINSNIVEVSPYTDYQLTFENTGSRNSIIVKHGTVNWGQFTNVSIGTGDIEFGFRFFKDIPNMTADVVDTI